MSRRCYLAGIVARHWLARGLLDRYRWFRRWHGGHWECWLLDGYGGEGLWFATPCCHRWLSGGLFCRPSRLCRGTPRCEHYPLGVAAALPPPRKKLPASPNNPVIP